MATYQRFEELPVWQKAVELYERVAGLLEMAEGSLSFAFRNQLERAALSVSNNVAEGFERGTTKELLAFIYVARGSSGEVRSMLLILSRSQRFDPFSSHIRDIISIAESCSRQLRAWADNLQNTSIKGTRHLNNTTRSNPSLAQRNFQP